jgi:hypothetical protein
MEIKIENITLKSAINTDNIYGAWILKDRIIPIYNDSRHAEYAIAILNSIFKINQKNRKINAFTYTKRYSIYRIMYRLGFIRLSIFVNFFTSVEIAKNYTPNEFQQRILNRVHSINYIDLYKVK